MAFHGGFALEVRATGDTDVDDHHLVEDTGIVIGQCLLRVADQQPVRRFGSASVPMDDALADVVIDAGGRPYCHFEATFDQQRVGAVWQVVTVVRVSRGGANLTVVVLPPAVELTVRWDLN